MLFRSDIRVTLPRRPYGDDELICQAARVSTVGTEAADTSESKGLINFLMKNRHGSPFEHGSMTFLIEAPIFVFREHHRHRAGWSYNEMSGRYKEMEPHFYVPPPRRNLVQVGKPGHYRFEPGEPGQHLLVVESIKSAAVVAWGQYQKMLANGIAKEVARSVLPVGIYSSMYATCNPRSLMHFLSLRTTSDRATFPSFPLAEIEVEARRMEAYFAEHWPLTYEAFLYNGRVAP